MRTVTFPAFHCTATGGSIPPATRVRPITRVGFIGKGEAVVKKAWPALQCVVSNGYPLDGVVVCSLESCSDLEGLPHYYHQIDPATSLLPVDRLQAQGFLTGNTLWVVATPSEWRVDYAQQVAELGRLALEKPPATTARQARLLLPLAHSGAAVYPMAHKLFNVSALAALAACRQQPHLLEQVRRIEGVFYEPAGLSPGRQQEDSVADVQYHPLVLLASLFKAAGIPFELTVDQVWVASYAPDPTGQYAEATVWTASRIRGHLYRHGQPQATYDLRQAKAAPRPSKSVQFFDARDALLLEVNWHESGWAAHARMLQALLLPGVDMHHSLTDAIAVMELIDASRRIACPAPTYAFGTLADFLPA